MIHHSESYVYKNVKFTVVSHFDLYIPLLQIFPCVFVQRLPLSQFYCIPAPFRIRNQGMLEVPGRQDLLNIVLG